MFDNINRYNLRVLKFFNQYSEVYHVYFPLKHIETVKNKNNETNNGKVKI